MSSEIQLLRQIARPRLDTEQSAKIIELWQRGINAGLLIANAEQHGIAPLLYHHLSALNLTPEQTLRQQLIALKVRHHHANQARQSALEEILALFATHKISTIILKGGALMNILYENIALRPMSDLDILVPQDQAQKAQSCLQELDYYLHKNRNPYLREHHHLPMASKRHQNTAIHVEIHTDALSNDTQQSIQFDNLMTPPIAFKVGEQTTYSLGHMDMLRHLCHHTLEPVKEIKLIGVSDIYGYAQQYMDHLDSDFLNASHPFVRNTMQMFHYLTPLPQSLRTWITVPNQPAPSGIGSGFAPLSETLGSTKSRVSKVRDLFVAPAWWMHCFYEVSPKRSLWATRIYTHPKRVMKWVVRRLRSKYLPSSK